MGQLATYDVIILKKQKAPSEKMALQLHICETWLFWHKYFAIHLVS